MNKYNVKVELEVEANNPEAAIDMIREFLEEEIMIIEFTITSVDDAR